MSYRFPVEAGQIMLFARAVGDDNPIYHDDAYARQTDVGGVIAPPTFTQSCVQYDPEWEFRPRVNEPWLGSGKEPTGRLEAPQESTNLLHAEQHFTYHRHARPGDVLSLETHPGRSWEKQGRRGGMLRFSETVLEYRDQHGELVITATSVGVVTEQVVEQPGVSA